MKQLLLRIIFPENCRFPLQKSSITVTYNEGIYCYIDDLNNIQSVGLHALDKHTSRDLC